VKRNEKKHLLLNETFLLGMLAVPKGTDCTRPTIKIRIQRSSAECKKWQVVWGGAKTIANRSFPIAAARYTQGGLGPLPRGGEWKNMMRAYEEETVGIADVPGLVSEEHGVSFSFKVGL